MGREEEALAQPPAATSTPGSREIEGGGLDAIVITASGCGTTIKDYGFMLREDPAYAEKAARSRVWRRTSRSIFRRSNFPSPPSARDRLTVAYHSACSMQHGQKIVRQPKEPAHPAGFVVKEPAEGHLCCGSAGTYNILQPEIASALRDRKVGTSRRAPHWSPPATSAA
jgi:glycolate oxidase iron-sulfur subunit